MSRTGTRLRIVGIAAAIGLVATVLLTADTKASAAGSEGLSSRLVPTDGALIGAWVDLDGRWTSNTDAEAEVKSFESTIDRKLDIDSHYYSWTNTFPSGLEQWDISNGRIPLVTWEAWGTTLKQINSGMYDAMIRSRARGLKNLGAPVFLRWGHEMNGNWYPWSGSANNDQGATNGPARYVSAFRRIHNLFESEGANNVVWVWSPNSESVPNTAWNHWRKYYPGDAYVDWVGIDGYNWGTSESWSSWRSFARIFRPVYDDYAGRKPIMIAETGSVEQGGDKARWIAGMWTQVQVKMTRIDAVLYFNAPGWSVKSTSTAERKFRNMATSPHFERVQDKVAPEVTGLQGDSGEVIDVTYEGSEPARVSVKVKNNSGDVVRTLRSYRWASPIMRSTRWDTRSSTGRMVPEGTYRVEILATDHAGHSTTAAQSVSVSR